MRINPGQLSQNTPEGTQARFNRLMSTLAADGKLVWPSPHVATKMGCKDALVKIAKLNCGLPDTFAYYSAEQLELNFKQTCAFQPRVIKQNHGSSGEGIWLIWLWDLENNKEAVYPAKTLGEASLPDTAMLKLMEMNDNHVEFHTIKEFITFCAKGPGGEAGEWASNFPGKYLGAENDPGMLIDQRLLPRVKEGEIRVLMVADKCQMIIHKKPINNGLSTISPNAVYTFHSPDAPQYADLQARLLKDLPHLMETLGLQGEPLPLLWTADYIPKDPETPRYGGVETEYVVGEFNCSCVGISQFVEMCNDNKSLADISDDLYYEGSQVADLMGTVAVQNILRAKLAKPEY